MGKKTDDNDNGTDLGKLAKILGEIPTEQPASSDANKSAEPSDTPEQPKAPGDDEDSVAPQT